MSIDFTRFSANFEKYLKLVPRWVLIEGYHALGKRILEDEPRMVRGGSDLRDTLSRVTKYLDKNERTLYRAIQFARKYPDLSLLPEAPTPREPACLTALPGMKAEA
jgi:hypothetical protein